MNNNTINNLSLILQALSLEILFKDCTNNSIMNELQIQDKEYLEKIINQNNEILNILKRKEDNDERKVREEN